MTGHVPDKADKAEQTSQQPCESSSSSPASPHRRTKSHPACQAPLADQPAGERSFPRTRKKHHPPARLATRAPKIDGAPRLNSLTAQSPGSARRQALSLQRPTRRARAGGKGETLLPSRPAAGERTSDFSCRAHTPISPLSPLYGRESVSRRLAGQTCTTSPARCPAMRYSETGAPRYQLLARAIAMLVGGDPCVDDCSREASVTEGVLAGGAKDIIRLLPFGGREPRRDTVGSGRAWCFRVILIFTWEANLTLPALSCLLPLALSLFY